MDEVVVVVVVVGAAIQQQKSVVPDVGLASSLMDSRCIASAAIVYQ